MLELVLIIAEQIFLYVPLLIGSYISFSVMKIPNLGIEAAFASGAIVASKVLACTYANGPMHFAVICLASLLGGMLVGVIVAMLELIGNIPHLLASILALGLCYGLNLYFLGDANVSLSGCANSLSVLPIVPMFPELATLCLLGIGISGIVFLLLRTQLGFCLLVYGNNPQFFSHYGISTAFVLCFGLIVSTALAGFSGYLVCQSNGFVDINMGNGMSLFCLTALILGKVPLQKVRRATIFVPLLGLFVYNVIQQLLLQVGLNIKYFMMIQSIVVLILLCVQFRRGANSIKGDHLGV